MTEKTMGQHKIAPCFILLFFLAVFLSGCCKRYDYDEYRKEAELQLTKKRFKKARNLYSVIYDQESKADKIDKEKIAWAFYRLGVISEVQRELVMALGYYWGDEMDEGYYKDFPKLNWFAQAGWNHLDTGNYSRSLDEILKLEAKGLPGRAPIKERKKKKVVVRQRPKRSSTYYRPGSNKQKGPVAVYNRSMTPMPHQYKGPFKVFY